MIIGILQPMYLPWLGYFEQIKVADKFVILDNVQYTKQDWRNRNRVKTATGLSWLTVPVKNCALGTPLYEIQISSEVRWKKKHLRTIQQNYSRAPYFQPFFSQFEETIVSCGESLVSLNLSLTKLICSYLKISTPLFLASEIDIISATDSRVNSPDVRLLKLCNALGCQTIYEGASGKDYMQKELYLQHGVDVRFQRFHQNEYPQMHGKFAPNCSAIDAVMNVGPAASELLDLSNFGAKQK